MHPTGEIGRGSLPNIPAGFAIASAICMLGVGIIEVAKFADSTIVKIVETLLQMVSSARIDTD